MSKRVGGARRKTRHKLSKNVREKGKISLTKYFQEFKTGDRVYLVAEPSVHEGRFYPRFYGKSGIISGKRGKCYEVQIKDINKPKTIIAHPIHLKRA